MKFLMLITQEFDAFDEGRRRRCWEQEEENARVKARSSLLQLYNSLLLGMSGYTMSQKTFHPIVKLISSNLDRFSELFHRWKFC